VSRDYLPALELAAKSVRTAFAAIGAAVHASVPMSSAERAHAASMAFEEENEVLEPARLSCDDDPHVIQPCGRCRLGDSPCVNLETPAASATDAVEGIPPAGAPPTPAGADLTWIDWALPAIFDVLAEHEADTEYRFRVVTCFHADSTICAEFADMQDWRDHVGPIIADRIGCDPERAAAALAKYSPK
jgi:hypothetical protein